MGLIDRLRAALGLEPRESARTRQAGESSGQDVAVTVEHEPDTASEDAVKGTETDESAGSDAEEPSTESAEETAQETGTEPDTDGTGDTDEPATDESGETGEDESGAEDDAADEDGDEATEPTEETETAGTDESADVQSINGIGPAYAERLGEAGIETVADLADADAPTVAEESGIAESRVSTWIERAGQ